MLKFCIYHTQNHQLTIVPSKNPLPTRKRQPYIPTVVSSPNLTSEYIPAIINKTYPRTIMKIAIASGKGGTGKTTVAINLAKHLTINTKNSVMLLDCDVEGANDNLFLNSKFDDEKSVTAKRPIWNKDKCNLCGECVSVCQYNALAKVKDKILVFDELCHSCGACAHLCPEKAFTMKAKNIGIIQTDFNSSNLKFGQGELNIGESMSPMVINQLKKEIIESEITLLDAPPGATCPVVKTLEDVNYCILVTEPTPFGLNDLKLAAALTEEMKIKTGIVINRSNNDDSIIEEFAHRSNIPIVGIIPFEKRYAKSYSDGKVLIEEHPELVPIFDNIYKELISCGSIPKIKRESSLAPISKEEWTAPPTQKSRPRVKELVVISGKGGTGKTTLTSSFSFLGKDQVISDSDVDASNLSIVVKGALIDAGQFVGGKSYVIDEENCTQCGQCLEHCQFDAISNHDGVHTIGPFSCEGCGLCSRICPADAISSKDAISGNWFISKTPFGYMSHAKLGVAEENSGKLVSLVRENAGKLASYTDASQILNDGPPGTGCPAISSITGADLAIIVVEPTLSGIHDMKRAIELVQHFGIPSKIVINKFDLNTLRAEEIKEVAKRMSIETIGSIAFDNDVNKAHKKNITIVEYSNGSASLSIKKIWAIVNDILENI